MAINKYADGLAYVLFPGNIAYGYAGYNFPESTAQDDGAGVGNISLSLIGSTIPYLGPTDIEAFGYGPSGFYSVYTPLATLNSDTYIPFTSYPALPASRVYSAVDPGAPNLKSIFSVDKNAATEASYGDKKKQTAISSISEINILDLICEGPIEGFPTGKYYYSLSGKTTGDIGYTSAIFEPYGSTNSAPQARSIFWDDTPLADQNGLNNFQYSNYKFSYGEKSNDHTIFNPYLNIYEERRNYFGKQVDNNKIPLQTSVTKQINERIYGYYLISGSDRVITPKTYYIYNTDVSSIQINIKISSLYEQIVKGTNAGDIEQQEMQFQFVIYRVLKDYSLVQLDTSRYPPFEPDAWSNDEITLKGKVTSSPVIWTYHITLRPFAENKPTFKLFDDQIGWAIDIIKQSREATSSSLKSESSIDSITEVYSDRFVYPDSALVFSKFDARYFSAIPTRSYLLKLLKVKIPVNYDPITRNYSGPWNGKFKVAWTDNPAWCFYDIITNNRFGLGKYIDEKLADKWNLYEISQYCDQLVSDGVGGLEPRFTCNVMFNTKEEAYKVLNDMASLFLGILYYSAGQIFLSQDSPKDSVYLFNNSNVIAPGFSYSDASKKSRKTVAIVRYNDENDNYKPAIEVVEDVNAMLKLGVRETEITSFGCTNKNQARRAGKWLLATQNSNTEIVEFQAGLEGSLIRPGDVISIYDQARKNLTYAGRTLELTTGYAVLDLPYDSINTYALTGVNVNNSFIFDVITPTYNLDFGTDLGNLYATGYSSVNSSGVSGLNSSFFKRSQIQSIKIDGPKNYLTSGSGIYSNNIRINFPYINSIPENITPVNMSVVGNTFTKIAGGTPGIWDAQAYSSVGYSKNMFVEATSNTVDRYVMFGLDSNPAENASYDTLDYAWYFINNGDLAIWESNAQIGTYGSYTTSTRLRINYDGEWITYLKDGEVVRSTPATNKNQTLYFDSSFGYIGASINANYGTFALNNYLNTLPQSAPWIINIDTTGYLAAGINTKSNINNDAQNLYPGYYLESYLNKPQKYKVLNIAENDNALFTISALEYNDQKFKDIDNIGQLVNAPIRPASPTTPNLILSTIFRDTNGCYYTPYLNDYATYGCGSPEYGDLPYSTNQTGINSIMYNIIPPANSSNTVYYTYVKTGTNFGSTTPSESFVSAISSENLQTGISFNAELYTPIFPPFITPLRTGSYFFRVFAQNSIGERSSPATGLLILKNQISAADVQASGINVY